MTIREQTEELERRIWGRSVIDRRSSRSSCQESRHEDIEVKPKKFYTGYRLAVVILI
jgi:hypothetical protein